MSEIESAPRTVRDVVCGFCGLGCDDLTVETDGRMVRARDVVCPEAAKLFLRRADAPVPQCSQSGVVTSESDALDAARVLLAGAKATLVAGLGVDIDGGRAVLDLVGRFGGVIDHYASEGLFRNYTAAQRTGWLSTTLAEVRNRCDVLLVIGDDPTAVFGRLFERIVPPNPLFASSRKVIFLGAAPGEKARGQLGHADIVHLEPTDLVAALEAVVGGVQGRTLRGETIGGVPTADLAAAAAALKDAGYAVVTWNSATLSGDGGQVGALVAERATALVDALNVTTRAGVFPLGGRDNIIGVNQMLLWRIGYPLRTAIRSQIAEHDGTLFSTAAALKDADLLVWVSAFRPEPPPEFDGPVIAIAHPETRFARPPEVFIPVGTPGIDHAGTVFRMDSIVSLPLGALRVATLPSVAEAVRLIAGEAA
ncbi:formylmethanofuran dehydrogenase [Ancylobacter sp. 6x-1]|uniref:Formylmethanofuran dehydrogenase n=1 Tax=Ancylobacter crimeensis TaxID=2579147 RepID=A0ABT0D8M7_9HYPH|nr:formylmethanofuran dehydrogenase [Ancylobacter crimeensis]MCK0196297.1 formylmethanofuran dehydrogenase [Ancylobacter crimeensis]